jgi:hypothetical protein
VRIAATGAIGPDQSLCLQIDSRDCASGEDTFTILSRLSECLSHLSLASLIHATIEEAIHTAVSRSDWRVRPKEPNHRAKQDQQGGRSQPKDAPLPDGPNSSELPAQRAHIDKTLRRFDGEATHKKSPHTCRQSA